MGEHILQTVGGWIWTLPILWPLSFSPSILQVWSPFEQHQLIWELLRGAASWFPPQKSKSRIEQGLQETWCKLAQQ